MRGKSKIVLLLVLLLAVVGVAGLALLMPFTTDSAVKGYEYRVNTLRVNWYLLANGYSKKHSGVKIDLVETPQTGFRLTGKGANRSRASRQCESGEGRGDWVAGLGGGCKSNEVCCVANSYGCDPQLMNNNWLKSYNTEIISKGESP